MRNTFNALILAASIISVGPVTAYACPALAGITSYDSKSVLVGDPFFGGGWSNAANSRAYIRRKFTNPVTIRGLYIGSAGSDVTTAGSTIRVTLTDANGNVFVAFDARETGINRPMSGPGTMLQSQTVTFPPFTATNVAVTMTGNGWFLFQKAVLFADGCSQ